MVQRKVSSRRSAKAHSQSDENNTPVAPYFKVRVTIKEVHLRNVPSDFRLIPGMTIVGDIMVGRRTILSYLVEGAMRTGSEAMREPVRAWRSSAPEFFIGESTPAAKQLEKAERAAAENRYAGRGEDLSQACRDG